MALRPVVHPGLGTSSPSPLASHSAPPASGHSLLSFHAANSLPPAAGCCTLLSLFGALILLVIGYGFAHNWEAFMGSTSDPADGGAVAATCYGAALVFVGFVGCCACQMGTARYSRIALD